MDARRPVPRKPDDVRESLVFEHPQDVSVGANQRLVERLEVVLPSGDVCTLDIPGELGEPYDDQRFACRRKESLEALARSWNPDALDEEEGPLPAILSRAYALWTYSPEGGQAQGGQAQGGQAESRSADASFWRFGGKQEAGPHGGGDGNNG